MATVLDGQKVVVSTAQIDSARIQWRREPTENEPRPGDPDLVVYWMQQSQRATHNHALEFAVQSANERSLPLAVLFCLAPDYPHASQRHFAFLLEGLARTAADLERRGMSFDVFVNSPIETIEALAHRISLLVMDRGHLPIQRSWRSDVVDAFDGPVAEVDADVVVPPHLVSDHLETAARTIRPKIHEHLDRFLVDLRTTALERTSVAGGDSPVSLPRSAPELRRFDLDHWQQELDSLGVATEPGPVDGWSPGPSGASAQLRSFCEEVLPDYANRRNRFDLDGSSSRLSPFLHFGQISPVDIVVSACSSGAPAEHVDAFVEEVVVRRELAVNHAIHNPAFDAFAGLPEWARETLETHGVDDRRGVVTAAQLAAGETDDELWNTIMGVIRRDGWVHNQLRMYWGKQILYWTNTPGHGYRTLLDLNNTYFLDGRDVNSFANVAWCFGRHDQGFQERDVIGKLRPFTDQALRRKGDLDAWLEMHRAAL